MKPILTEDGHKAALARVAELMDLVAEDAAHSDRQELEITMLNVEVYELKQITQELMVENAGLVAVRDSQATQILGLQQGLREMEAEQGKLKLAAVRLGACPACWHSAWEPCEPGTPDAIKDQGSATGGFMVCMFCELEKNYRKLDAVRLALSEQVINLTAELVRTCPAPKVFAPFTPEQVEALNAWQQLGYIHPFTCPSGCGPLVAHQIGWRCPVCDNAQNWAHDFMADQARHPGNPFDSVTNPQPKSPEKAD